MRRHAGPQIAPGRVPRGDALGRLAGADVGRLGAFGLRVVVDFRVPGELLVNGEDRLPPGATRVSLPVNGGELGALLARGLDLDDQTLGQLPDALAG